jgi:hypothetical protein
LRDVVVAVVVEVRVAVVTTVAVAELAVRVMPVELLIDDDTDDESVVEEVSDRETLVDELVGTVTVALTRIVPVCDDSI